MQFCLFYMLFPSYNLWPKLCRLEAPWTALCPSLWWVLYYRLNQSLQLCTYQIMEDSSLVIYQLTRWFSTSLWLLMFPSSYKKKLSLVSDISKRKRNIRDWYLSSPLPCQFYISAYHWTLHWPPSISIGKWVK